ncbi:hypothetical protein [Lysobacter sp. HA18]
MIKTPTTGPLARCLPAFARASKVTIAALLSVNVLLLGWFIATGYRGYFHSDAAAKSLLAQEMLRSGRVFPPDWNYVNGDLMVLFGQWFVLPFLLVMRNGWAAYAVSMLVSAILILLSTWWAARLVVPGRWPRLAVLAIVASGLSVVTTDNLFGQVSYGNVHFLACFVLVLAWRAIVTQGRARAVASVGVGLLAVGLFWGNPQRAAASQGLPLLAACALHLAMARDWRQAARDVRWPTAALLAGLIVGSGLHAYTLAHVQNHLGAGNARWLDFNGMQANAFHAIHGLLALLGCMPTPGRAVVGVVGAWEAIRLLAGIGALVLMPVAMAWSLRSVRPASVRFFGAFTLVSFALVFVLHVTTTIPDMVDPAGSARYLVPPLLFSLVLVAGMVIDVAVAATWRGLGGGTLLVLAASAFTGPVSDVLRTQRPDPRVALIHALKNAGLVDGYGTYWNAGAVTVLSGDRLHVRQIYLEHGLPVPMRHLGSNRWYRPDGRRGPTFLLLTAEEAKTVDWASMQRFLGAPARRFSAGSYEVVVYARNPAEALPNWNEDLSHPISIVMSGASPHQVGQYDQPGRALVAQVGEVGALHFGPYLPIPEGHYEASFDVECDRPAPGGCGKVDVAGEGGTVVFGEAAIPAGARARVLVRFDVARWLNDAELRVFVDGAGRVRLRGISVRPVTDAR